jgi:uncharacterized pyridoxamine 5'-phosphate oxidase family protein
MQRVIKFLQGNGTFFAATADGELPKVRPFGFVMSFEGTIYFTTGNKKNVYRELQSNPRVQFCSCAANGAWLRLSGKAVFDGNMDAKKKAFELMPEFKDIYKEPSSPDFEVFYLDEASAVIYGSFAEGGRPERVF